MNAAVEHGSRDRSNQFLAYRLEKIQTICDSLEVSGRASVSELASAVSASRTAVHEAVTRGVAWGQIVIVEHAVKGRMSRPAKYAVAPGWRTAIARTKAVDVYEQTVLHVPAQGWQVGSCWRDPLVAALFGCAGAAA